MAKAKGVLGLAYAEPISAKRCRRTEMQGLRGGILARQQSTNGLQDLHAEQGMAGKISSIWNNETSVRSDHGGARLLLPSLHGVDKRDLRYMCGSLSREPFDSRNPLSRM
ncbi:hypothetical protein SEA_LITTLEFELLA_6 [Gordonia phage LittleFella]|nr:hypothetical protein SEA_LITTLEFELLA_6 [Gordonia phage LittleFella]